MVVAVSSLSVAVQEIATFLDSELGPEVSVSVRNPQGAKETADSSNNAHILNLFVYRITPSGFHPELASDEPFFIRLHALLTPFLGQQRNQATDADLRILGHAVRILSSTPVLPTLLPGLAGGGAEDFRNQSGLTDYRIQAVLQAPAMEELNHIWTTQGGDLAYRLSAAYEFALIPIEPTVLRTPPVPTRTAIFDVAPGTHEIAADGFYEPEEDSNPIPLAGPAGETPPTDWLPVVLVVDGTALTTRRDVTAGTASVDVALSGLPGERVALEVVWTRAASPEVPDTQAPQVFQVQTARFNDPAARVTLQLIAPVAGDMAIVQTRPVDGADQPLAASPFANTLTLTVTP